MFLIEGVRREPLSLRARELAQTAGLLVIVTLMGFALWNDFSRNWGRFVEWLGAL